VLTPRRGAITTERELAKKTKLRFQLGKNGVKTEGQKKQTTKGEEKPKKRVKTKQSQKKSLGGISGDIRQTNRPKQTSTSLTNNTLLEERDVRVI